MTNVFYEENIFLREKVFLIKCLLFKNIREERKAKRRAE
jgi:hypothetical protein